jgi:transposase
VDAGQRCCAECGEPFEFLGTEDSEQIDWQVKITRIVSLRRRYQRRCSHPGPRTVCAPPAAKPVPKGPFTAGFLARLAYEKHVLGRPVHRIVQALAADGFDVAPGTLAGALKQIAPLIAPWAAVIAAHGRQAGHVHADETSCVSPCPAQHLPVERDDPPPFISVFTALCKNTLAGYRVQHGGVDPGQHVPYP